MNRSIPYLITVWILLVVLSVGCKQKDQKNAPSLFNSSGGPTRVVPPATGAAVGTYTPPNTNAATSNRNNSTTFYGTGATRTPSSYPNASSVPTNVPNGIGSQPAPSTTSTGIMSSAGAAQPSPQGVSALTVSNPASNPASQLAWRSPVQTNRANPITNGINSTTSSEIDPTQLAMTSPPTVVTTPLLTPVQVPPPPTDGTTGHTAVAMAANSPISRQSVLPVAYDSRPSNDTSASVTHPLSTITANTMGTSTTNHIPPTNVSTSGATPNIARTVPQTTQTSGTTHSIWNTMEDGSVPTSVPPNIRPRPIDAATIQ